VDPRAGLEAVVKRKIPTSASNRTSTAKGVLNLYSSVGAQAKEDEMFGANRKGKVVCVL
jgi:hypothetical protein